MNKKVDSEKSKKHKQPRITQFVPELKDIEKSPYYLDLKPILKWVGGKRGLIPHYDKYFPISFNKYYEPFLGGGAVFFHLLTKGRIQKAKLTDINEELLNVYNVIKTSVEDLIQELKSGKYINDKEVFYNIRAEELSDPILRAARLIYLNRTCYNGLYRVNKQGKFNVPYGKYPKNVRIFDEKNMRNVSESFQNIVLTIEDFEEAVKDTKKGDFVYLDPPYVPLTDTAYFTDYTSEGFGIKEHERLAKVFRKLDKRGCLVMESNSSASIIWELYEGFDIQTVHAKRYISCDPNGRGGVKETFIRNFKTNSED